MAKTLITTPFPTTAEVAAKLGVSAKRVRAIERSLFGDTVVEKPAARKRRRKSNPAPVSRKKVARGK